MVAAWAGYFSKDTVTVREPGLPKRKSEETPADSGMGTRFKKKIKKKNALRMSQLRL